MSRLQQFYLFSFSIKERETEKDGEERRLRNGKRRREKTKEIERERERERERRKQLIWQHWRACLFDQLRMELELRNQRNFATHSSNVAIFCFSRRFTDNKKIHVNQNLLEENSD
jgi:hypothetical protein